jgi:hypothetical protein
MLRIIFLVHLVEALDRTLRSWSITARRNSQRLPQNPCVTLWPSVKPAGFSNRTINRERDFLPGVLKMAKRWQLIAHEVRPLPGGESAGRFLQKKS